MAWSETAFRARLKERAIELGKPLRALLADAGIGHDTIDKEPASGRRVDTLEKIATAFQWTLAEVMGHDVLLGRISLELSQMAFASAHRVIARLPVDAQTDERLIEAHAHIYDVLVARQREGEPNDATHLASIEQMLVRAWENAASPPTITRPKR
jgi:hypothetical protein